MPDREMTKYLEGVVGVVEANSFERLCLWQDYAKERKTKWIEARSGLGETIGHLADMPVHVSLLVEEVDGHKLLFIHATSRVVDHEMVKQWLRDNLPKSAMTDTAPIRPNFVDAMNFHNVFPRAKQAA